MGVVESRGSLADMVRPLGLKLKLLNPIRLRFDDNINAVLKTV